MLLFADILIADNDLNFIRTARTVLQNAGYTVRRVESAQALWDSLTSRSPDLILLAVSLADGDGYDVARQLKAHPAWRLIPVIMLAEGDMQQNITAALNAGADEFLYKPVSHAELLVRVRAMLRLKRATDALTEMNATLEQRVLERTQALEEAHARLRHNEKLSALGHMAASVAHDINNPLSGILSYLYLIQQEIPADSTIQEDLALVERQVSVIVNLVRRLQSFSKPPRADRIPVALPQILDDILALMRKDLQYHDIQTVCHCDAELPMVLAAPDQLSEVCMNLIVNARDAMPNGGTLTIAADAQDAEILVRISDTGTGIPPDIMEHIFEPFFTTKGEQGTGLGLAICYRIVQEHQGDITVESTPGEGTTFTVRLPITR